MKKASRSGDRGKLLVLLEAAQDKSAHISRDTMVELAESLDISIGEVYGVASFYSFLSFSPVRLVPMAGSPLS